jgi:hypothetical protein
MSSVLIRTSESFISAIAAESDAMDAVTPSALSAFCN